MTGRYFEPCYDRVTFIHNATKHPLGNNRSSAFIQNSKEKYTYLIDPTDLGRGGSEGRSVTLCERALLARCWKYNSLENCGLAVVLFSSGFGAVGLVGTAFEFAFDKVSMKLYTTAFSERYHMIALNRAFID